MFAFFHVLRLRVLLVAGLIAVTSLSVCQAANAQTTAANEWTWVSGSNTGSQPGVYGTLGVPASGNAPGGRNHAISWTDSSGHFWLFGGFGYYASGKSGYLNDFWEFNPSNGEWSWMGGSSTSNQPPVYGTLGTPAAGNVPGGRDIVANWTDSNGHLWLFGGIDNNMAFLNDLWKYIPSTNQWVWMTGSSTVNCIGCSNPGVYGTLGTPAAGNTPGSRYGTIGWTDSTGHLWLFGGIGPGSELNDLWEFNPASNEWAWMGGSSSSGFEAGVYGTLGVPAAANIPGSRTGSATWTDSNGNLWLFGGDGWDISGNGGYLNDLWEFSPSTKEWTWMGGGSTVPKTANGTGGNAGVYGTLGTPAAGNVPGGRDIVANWTDSNGHLWLFGGDGFDANGNAGSLNDLWEFNPSLNTDGEWVWMGGSSTVNHLGTYGTSGSPASGNIPGSRYGHVWWTDSSDNFWLFGGYGYDTNGNQGNLNDLWEYEPLPPPNTTTTTLTPAPTPNPSYYGESVTLKAAVTSSGGTPPNGENVSFRIGTTTLGTAQLSSGVASLTTTALPTGTDSVTAIYGGDASFAGSTSTAVSQVVNEATPSVTAWPTASSITYGQTLASSTLSGGASTPAGSFAFTTPTTAPNAGIASQSVTFTPTDATDYSTLTGTASVTVGKATPSVTTWPTASSITYGQTLASSTLSGGASTPAGSFAFTTPKTVPNAGTASQSVTFIPTDTTDYTGASGSVQLIVNKTTPTITWPAPANVSAGTALSSTQLDATFSWTVVGSTVTVPGNPVYLPASGTVESTFGAQTLSVTFTPTDTTDYTAASATVTLTVNKATPSVTTWPTASSITYGQTLASSTLSGGASTPAGSFAFTTPTTKPNAGTASQSVTFTPTDTTDYSTLTGTASVTVSKATSSVTTWPTASSITYGQTLASSTLSGGASTPAGSFAFTTPITAPGAGTASQSVTFTPTDATDYTTATSTVSLTVNKSTPAITWPTPAAITNGTALSATQLDASSAVAGTFVYTPVTGTVLATGTQTLSVTLTPTDTTDYTTATATVNLVVNQGTSTITWTTPTAITYGTALSVIQLDASSTVAGTFAYTPAAGSVPKAGTQTLSVTFTPTDTTDYTTATATKQLVVNQATPAIIWPTPAAITNGTALSATQLDASSAVAGTFVYTPVTGTVLAPGTQTLSVTFTPTDTTDYMTATTTVQLNVTNITVSGTAVSVAPGASTGNTSTITVTPVSGFTGTVGLSCAISPTAASDPATCSLSPASVAISGAAQTSTLTVYTTAASSSALVHPKLPGVPWYAASGVTLACLLLFGIPARRRSWRTMLGMLALLIALSGGVLACGGGSSTPPPPSNPGTTAGTYTITVTGTSGTITATNTGTLTVQ
jgi:N-acetylneuraminic acid mutarotase